MYDEKPAEGAPSAAAVPETTADGTIVIPEYDAAPATMSNLGDSLGIEKEAQVPGDAAAQHQKGEDVAEETLSTEEKAWWVLMGLGCTYFINDTMFLQLAWWIGSQPEGLLLGNRIALAGSQSPIIATVIALVLRKYRYEQVQKYCMPTLICFSISAGLLLALGLWEVSSNWIYLSMVLASTVGATTPYLAVPWVMGSGYKPACISPMFLGGSVGSLCAATLALYQSPGQEKLFSPTLFFAIVTTPVFGSLYAYQQISTRGIGKSAVRAAAGKPSSSSDDAEGGGQNAGDAARPVEPAAPPPAGESSGGLVDGEQPTGCVWLVNAVPAGWDKFLGGVIPGWRKWIGSVWALALWLGFIAMCTWTVSRAVMGFASAHTITNHHACHHLPAVTAGDGGLIDNELEGQEGCERFCSEIETRIMNPSEDDLKAADQVCNDACLARNVAEGTIWPCTAGCDRAEVEAQLLAEAEAQCDAEPACTIGHEGGGGSGAYAECKENKGERWLQLCTALAQWAYTSGIGLTVIAPSHQLWRISAIWVAGFSMLTIMAVVGDGTFELGGFGGFLVVSSALTVRCTDGYMGIMVFRLIAERYREDEQAITVFFGLTAVAVNFFGSIVSTVLVETGTIAD